MKRPLTKNQTEVLDFIKAHIKAKKISPTISEIMEKFDMGSPCAHRYINELVARGYLEKDSTKRPVVYRVL